MVSRLLLWEAYTPKEMIAPTYRKLPMERGEEWFKLNHYEVWKKEHKSFSKLTKNTPKTDRRYHKIFRYENLLQHMLQDYDKGMSINALANKYECDRTSIRIHLGEPRKMITKEILAQIKATNLKPTGKYADILYEEVNEGKTYKQYLKKK